MNSNNNSNSGNSSYNNSNGNTGPVQLVIFDCDGVLVDSERLAHQAICDELAARGINLSLDEAYARFMGCSSPEFWPRLGLVLGHEPTAEEMASLRARTQATFEAELQPVPGVAEVLDALDRRGTPYCVASNGRHEKMQFTLTHTGLMSRLHPHIFAAEDVPHPKPAPDLFLHAARHFKAQPAHCVVVEDSPTGIRAARAAGMTALGYAGMTPADRLLQAGAHATFDRMDELLATLASMT